MYCGCFMFVAHMHIRCQGTRDVMTTYFELRVSPDHAQEMAAMAKPQWSASNTIDFFRTLVRGPQRDSVGVGRWRMGVRPFVALRAVASADL